MITGIKVDGPENCQKALNVLIENGATVAVITMGEQGIVFCTRENPVMVNVAVPQVKAVDTTVGVTCGVFFLYSRMFNFYVLGCGRLFCRIVGLSIVKISRNVFEKSVAKSSRFGFIFGAAVWNAGKLSKSK